jgi:hypothetical protein
VPGAPGFEQPQQSGVSSLQKALGSADVTKALSPELVDSVRNALAQSEIGKAGSEWTTANPVPTGLVAFDLEAPAKLLTPRPTPLRNRIARRRGIGLAHRFKRITGFTGTGTGGIGIFRPGITEGGTTYAGNGTQFPPGVGPTYLRGATISYAGDDQAVNYKQFSVSDSVSWAAQFSGQGYEDVRQLSQTTLLYSSMLLEERMLLGARGTDSGFQGALAAPTGVTATLTPVGSTGYAAITGYGTNIYVRVTSECVWGDSVSTEATAITAASGQYILVKATLPQGATGMKVYVGTGSSDPGVAGSYYVGRASNGLGFVIQGALPTTGSTAPAADNSATSGEYDGLITYCMGTSAGYVNDISGVNGANSVAGALSANPGNEFNVAFASLYDSVKADPDEILANGHDRKQLSDLLKTSNSSNYRINLTNAGDAHNATIGAMVTGVQNEVTGKMVDITVHPWLPQGNMPIISWTLPLPDSQVSDVFAVYNVQDYMGIQWPVNQFLYESSSYWYGTFLCYAPAWCGAIKGITQV